MAKSEFLQIRMTPEGHQRLRRVAEADHLDKSTWARRAIMQALDRWEEEGLKDHRTHEATSARKGQLKVAEAKPPSATRTRNKQASTARTKSPSRRKPRE